MISFCKYWFDGQPITGCEVGVARGLNSLNILNVLNLKKLYLVDSYQKFYTFDGNLRCFTHMKDEAVSRLKGFGNVCFVFKDSKDAVGDIEGVLDFCYVDAGHCYRDVIVDLENFYPLVDKSLGVFGGHDYHIGDVKDAVSDFLSDKDLYLFVWGDDWWIVQNRKQL